MIGSELKNEESLLSRLTTGDQAAFTEIYNHYWSRLIALAFSHTKDRFLAEELVQEIFLGLWKNREVVSIRSLSSYLATAVKFSIFMNVSRRNRKEKILEGLSRYNSAVLNSDEHLQDDLLHAKFLEEYVNFIVEELPEKCKFVYLSSRKHHMKTAEIAESMNISTKTVEAHLTKALKLLRLNLKDVLMIVWLVKTHRF